MWVFPTVGYHSLCQDVTLCRRMSLLHQNVTHQMLWVCHTVGYHSLCQDVTLCRRMSLLHHNVTHYQMKLWACHTVRYHSLCQDVTLCRRMSLLHQNVTHYQMLWVCHTVGYHSLWHDVTLCIRVYLISAHCHSLSDVCPTAQWLWSLSNTCKDNSCITIGHTNLIYGWGVGYMIILSNEKENGLVFEA